MKTIRKKQIILPLLTLLLVSMMTVSTTCLAAQPIVSLGTTSTFAVLAGSAITNTGLTSISGNVGGNVGLSPNNEFTGQGTVTMTGVTYLADAVALQAKADLVTAYNEAAAMLPVSHIATELGGKVLTPGIYDSNDGTFQITGTLTLDAQGDPNAVFIFKTASTLITASGSNVNLINNANYSQVFWQVGSSATFGINSHIAGHIFAMISITATTGATVQGQLLAQTGAVTLDTNTIINGTTSVFTNSSISSSSSVTSSNSSSSNSNINQSRSVTTSSSNATSNVSANPDTGKNNMSLMLFLLAYIAISAGIVFVLRKKII